MTEVSRDPCDLVRCHYYACKSDLGEPCYTASGKVTKTHRVRLHDAEDVVAAALPKHADLLLPEYRQVRVMPRETYYLVDGIRYRRVSSILGVIHKHLGPWIRKITLKSVEDNLRNPDTIEGLKALFETLPVESDIGETSAETYGQALANWEGDYHGWVDRLLATAKAAADKVRDDAAEKGISIHEEIDFWQLDQEIPPFYEPTPQYLAARRFLDDYEIEIEATEAILWDSNLEVAGTPDVIGRRRRVRAIVDWKTGSGPWPEMALQLGGYGGFLADLTGEPAEVGYIVKLWDPNSEEDLSKIPECGYSVYAVEEMEEARYAFSLAYDLKRQVDRKWWN